MPSTFLNSQSRTRGPSDHGMLLYNLPFAISTRAKGDKLQIDNNNDDRDSEKYNSQEQPSKSEITKTIANEVRSDDRNSVQVPDRAHNACY